MTESEFWRLVQATDYFADAESLANELRTRLSELDNEQLAAFDKHFNLKMRASFHWDLWAAAYVIAGCNSDYGFADFRCWLVSRGQAIFEATLKDPDSLADHNIFPVKDELVYPYLDDYDLIAGLIFEERTGDELPFVPSGQESPKGKQFKDKPKLLKASYPKLFARFWIGG